MTRRTLSIYCAILIFVLCAAGCLSPTLPLPPPDDVSVSSPDELGMVTVEGTVNDDAIVSCLNERTEEGVITKSRSDGFFNLEIAAQVDDSLTVWQTIGQERGPSMSYRVPSEEESNQQ